MCASFDMPTALVALFSNIATLSFLLSVFCAYMAVRPARKASRAASPQHPRQQATANDSQRYGREWIEARNRSARQRRAYRRSQQLYA
jgi:hypothetical protein